MTTGHPPPPVARLDVDGFGDLFERFLNVVVHGRERPAPFIALLEAHFGTDPKALPVLSELMSIAQRPNLQVALDSYIAGSGRSAQLVGVNSPSRAHESLGFANLLQTQWNQTTPGAPEYAELALGGGRVLPSVDYGLYLVRDQDEPLAVLVSQPPQHGQPRLRLEILATSRERSSGLLAELRALMRQHNVYRGKAVRFEPNPQTGGVTATIQTLPKVRREEVILPPSVLERIERHTIVFSQHRDTLLAAGRHLRRGLLMHGPPGTGKTHTLSYLIGASDEWTAVIMSGRGLGMLSEAVALARELQPAIVVLEDVDLIAEDRGMHAMMGQAPMLFELLNEMDGLEDDADIVFALTTNRVDVLERAISERPGRIDLAVEIPFPDADGRRRLVELYGQGLTLEVTDVDGVVAKLEGTSAAFIKELLRRAALFAAERGIAPRVTDDEMSAALTELLESQASVAGKPSSVPGASPGDDGPARFGEGWTSYP